MFSSFVPFPVPPSAPSDISVDEVTDCSAIIRWKAPVFDDDEDDDVDIILSIRKKAEELEDYREVKRVPRRRLYTIIEELEEDEEYDLSVKAANKAGTSKDEAKTTIKTNKKLSMCNVVLNHSLDNGSQLSQSSVLYFHVYVTPCVLCVTCVLYPPLVSSPCAPQDLTVSDVTDSSVTLKWAAAESLPDVPIDGYVIAIQDTKGMTLETTKVSSTEDEYCVNNLAGDTPYLFSVKTQTATGFSEPVTLSSPVTTKPTANGVLSQIVLSFNYY